MSRLPYLSSRLSSRVSVGWTRKAAWPVVVLCAFGIGALLPGSAAAEATPGAEPSPGPTGLPDGRIYEEASPANKYGNQTMYSFPTFVAADGQAVMYGGSGAMAEEPTNSAYSPISVSERTSHGWTTRSAMPLPTVGSTSPEEHVNIGTLPTTEVPSVDMSRLLFGTWGDAPYVGAPDEPALSNKIYLEGSNPFAEPEWVGRSLIEGAPGGLESHGLFSEMRIAGASPDLKTIYFFYEAKLFAGASDLYEYKDGVLSDAGVLPGGETSTGIAAPAAQPWFESDRPEFRSVVSAAAYDNEVSADGSRIFFTRTDKAGALELYARVTAPDGSQSTVLISQSQRSGHSRRTVCSRTPSCADDRVDGGAPRIP